MRFLTALAAVLAITSLATAGEPAQAVDVSVQTDQIDVVPSVATDVEASVEVGDIPEQVVDFQIPLRVKIRPVVRANVSTIRTVDCVPCYQQPMTSSVDIDIDAPIPTPQPQPQPPQCVGGRCVQRVLGDSGGVRVNVDTRPRRGLFWRFRR